MTLSPILATVLLAAICSASDRVIGWGKYHRSMPVIVTSALLIAVGFLMKLPTVSYVTLPLAYLIWRTPNWDIYGGSLDSNVKQLPGTFVRHLMAIFFVFPAFWAGINFVPVVTAMIGFAVIATALSYINHKNVEAGKDINAKIEIIRGAVLGLLVGVSYFLS